MKIVDQVKEITAHARQEGRVSFRDDVRSFMRGEDVDSEMVSDLVREVSEWSMGNVDDTQELEDQIDNLNTEIEHLEVTIEDLEEANSGTSRRC